MQQGRRTLTLESSMIVVCHFCASKIRISQTWGTSRACFCRVGIQLPTVEVRFEHLTIEADCYIGSRALPTLLNTAQNIAESALSLVGIRWAKRAKLTILKDVSGIVKPSR